MMMGSALVGVLRRTVPHPDGHWVEVQLGAESLIWGVSDGEQVVGPVQLDGYLNNRCGRSCQSQCCIVVWRAASRLVCWQIRNRWVG
jgi:hypothetical protein